jgi:uncharacterized YigZ family protein
LKFCFNPFIDGKYRIIKLYLLCMTNKEIYRSVKSCTEGLFKEKGSKFLAFAFPCTNPEEAKRHIDLLWKKHPGAVHVCYAWRFGITRFEDRFSDDGEPSNSAGKPIFGQIIAFDLTNILVAVVRYYGGTNLGVGGLIQAYKTAAFGALNKAEIQEQYRSDYFSIRYAYAQTGEIENIFQKSGVQVISRNFDSGLPQVEVKVRQSLSLQFQKDLAGKATLILTQADQ